MANGEGEFHHRRHVIRGPKKRLRAERIAKAVAEEGVSEALVQRLKALRSKLARQRSVPAYVIFSDRTLIDMAAKRPLTKWDFGEVHGVGAAKLEQFAGIFLEEVRAYVTEEA